MRFTPHDYQRFAIDFIKEHTNAAVFLDMGLGKTVITLTALDDLLFDSFEVSRVLVVCPLRVAKTTWPQEIAKWDHLRHLRYSVVVGTPKERVAALSRPAELYIINRENVEWLVKHYAGRKMPFDMLIIDELSSFKNSRAKRFLALKKVLGQFTRVIGLTGTPAPNGLEDLWPQIYLLDRGVRLGRTMRSYEITNAWEQKGGGSWIFRIPALKPILLSNFRQKHIPDEYMCASEEQRWALLQGLMDSDGCIGARKAQSVYVSTIKDLADNVRELLWSLGIKNAMTEEPSTRYGIPTGETLYTIRFTTFEDQPTSRLERKYSRKRERTKKTRSCFHYLQDIQPLPYRVKMRCIQVDSPSRCYLAGRSFVPTHNSELAAGIALYMLCADNEEGAEIYGCANDRQQAAIVFDVAREIVQQSPILRERIRIIDSQKRMVYMPTHSIYQALSSEVASKYGYNVHACIFDELLGQSNRKLYETMTQGSGAARKQPLNFVITTAGSDRNSICYEVHRKAVDQLEGRKYDSTFYPVVYSAPETADWTDPKVWARANPSLGRTVDVEYYEQRCKSAMENPAEEIHFRQFHLCQWTNTSVRWMPMDKWDACAGRVDARMLEGRPCYAGLDLSSTTDLTTLVLVFPPLNEDDAYTVLPFFWLPEDTLALRVRRDHVMYDVWEKQGFLKTTEGNVVHYGFIEQFICQLGERYNIREIAYDRWNASMMVQTLQDDGFTMIPFGQGYKDMSPPTKELMRIVLEKKLNHGGHPVLRWNMDNAYVRTDPAGNIKIDKEKSTEKVDGAVALVMALDRAMKNLNGGDSVYNHRGLLIL